MIFLLLKTLLLLFHSIWLLIIIIFWPIYSIIEAKIRKRKYYEKLQSKLSYFIIGLMELNIIISRSSFFLLSVALWRNNDPAIVLFLFLYLHLLNYFFSRFSDLFNVFNFIFLLFLLHGLSVCHIFLNLFLLNFLDWLILLYLLLNFLCFVVQMSLLCSWLIICVIFFLMEIIFWDFLSFFYLLSLLSGHFFLLN